MTYRGCKGSALGGEPRRAEILGPGWNAWRARLVDELIELGWADEEAVTEARLAEIRMEARLAWIETLFERIGELHKALGEYWTDFFDAHPEIDDENPDPADLPPDPPEQVELEALEQALEDIRERDLWPRHLYFRNV